MNYIKMISEVLEAIDDFEVFTEWEIDFIKDMDDKKNDVIFSDKEKIIILALRNRLSSILRSLN